MILRRSRQFLSPPLALCTKPALIAASLIIARTPLRPTPKVQ